MNLKRINYGVNIIYKSNNINLNKIINELDSKFIKYEINNEIESFINVEVISQQNKIKFFVDDIEFKTITEVINKYNIVPKLFSKNLINDKYEIKLNKLEHKKDIKKVMEGEKTFLSLILRPCELAVYKVLHIREDEQMNAKRYIT